MRSTKKNFSLIIYHIHEIKILIKLKFLIFNFNFKKTLTTALE
jgi:hypothetical protein